MPTVDPFTGDEPSRLALVVVGLVLIVLVTIAVGLRIYSKAFLSKFCLEDWLIILATLSCIGLTTTTCIASLYGGWGFHIYDLLPPVAENSLKLLWISEIFFTWSLCFTKISICIFYLRLFNNGICRRIIYIYIVVVALWALGFSASIIAQCNPVKAAWRTNHQPGERCANIGAGVIAHTVVDTAMNLILWTLPSKLILGLGLRGKQRTLVLGLFVLGGIVCAASVIRIPYTIRTMQDFDTTRYLTHSYIWTILEASLAIFCASLPSLTPLLAKVMPGLYHGEYEDQSHLSHSRCSIVKGSSFSGGDLTLVGSAFPLAHISTTAISNKGCTAGGGGGGNWFHWPMGNAGGGGVSGERKAPNESEENIIASNDTLAGGMGITKTTVIEQSVSVDSEIEKRSPSPKLLGRVTF